MHENEHRAGRRRRAKAPPFPTGGTETRHLARVGGALRDLSRGIVLGALVFAPWAYGSTRPWAIDLLTLILGAAAGLWLAAFLLLRDRPRVPVVAVVLMAAVLAQGSWMALNAHSLFDTKFGMFVPIPAWAEGAPGSVDRTASIAMMLRVTGLLGALCIASDMVQRPAWRARLWWMVCAAGTSLIAFGLVQRMSGARMIFWAESRQIFFFFATYLYHANAGAFINLVLPMVAGLAVACFRRGESHLARALLAPAVVICMAGAAVTASKAAMAVSMLLVLVLAGWIVGGMLRARTRLSFAQSSAYVVIALAAVGAIAVSVGWELTSQRWEQFDHSKNMRLATYDVCIALLDKAGAGGYGPGTFQFVFAHEAPRIDPNIHGTWIYAHEDYLQTLIEWGWVGAALWGGLFFGGMFSCFAGWRRMRIAGSNRASALAFSAGLALLGVALHAAVDFPLQIASLQLYAAVYLGVGWGSRLWKASVPGRSGRMRRTDGRDEDQAFAAGSEAP